jgi:hypothetical protein
MVIAIDPSFTRCGVAVYNSSSDSEFLSIEPEIKEKGIVSIDEALRQAYDISNQFRKIIMSNTEEEDDYLIVVEYPILATRLGSYLGIITAKLDSVFRVLKCPTVIYLPAIAVASATKARTKTDLVKWVKEDMKIPFKGNHDEATAYVLAKLGEDVLNKKYKHSFKIMHYK